MAAYMKCLFSISSSSAFSECASSTVSLPAILRVYIILLSIYYIIQIHVPVIGYNSCIFHLLITVRLITYYKRIYS